MNKPNLVTLSIRHMKSGGYHPCHALVYAMITLAGGKIRGCVIRQHYHDWERRYGEPTWRSLFRWAASLDIEADICEAIHRARFGQKEATTV